jgi:hypothetical protein
VAGIWLDNFHSASLLDSSSIFNGVAFEKWRASTRRLVQLFTGHITSISFRVGLDEKRRQAPRALQAGPARIVLEYGRAKSEPYTHLDGPVGP